MGKYMRKPGRLALAVLHQHHLAVSAGVPLRAACSSAARRAGSDIMS
jgi:hypothetical protein